MATNQRSATDSPHTRNDSSDDPSASNSVSTDEYLELLGDEYARRILSEIMDEPRTGREIIDRTGISKPTVYRRLNRLEAAGLVTDGLELDLDGHHCKRFRAVVETIDFEFSEHGISVSIDTDSQSRPTDRRSRFAVADD
jgi:DNA-binding transcriptional ArsR family regulator